MKLNNPKIHQPDGNNVYGVIYKANIDENLLKIIAHAFNIAEQQVRFKVSTFDNAKSLIYCTNHLDFVVYQESEIGLFNGRFIGTEATIYVLLNQLCLDLAQKSIKSEFELYDETQNLIFVISPT